jgi:hypothetical protein
VNALRPGHLWEVPGVFISTSDGWQARMDGVMREYVAQQARRSS